MALKYRIGGILAGKTLILDEDFLSYKGVYGQSFSVPRSQIDTVVVDTIGRGKASLKIIGRGTTLASVDLPIPWAEKAQRWILENLKQKAA